MNKRGHIKKLSNSSLTQSLRELEKSSLDGLMSYLRADFPTQPTNLAQDTRIANALKKFASHKCKNSSTILEFASYKNAESTLDFADSQNLVKNNPRVSANFIKSFCYFWLLPKVESLLSFNHNLPSKADSQNLQGGWLLRNARKSFGLPRRFCESARNDEFFKVATKRICADFGVK